MRDFKDVLKELREEKNLSQKELAEALDLGYSTIGMYESGSRMPKYDILEKIAEYFQVDINYLLGKSLTRLPYQEKVYSSWGDDQANLEYLADKPELMSLYNEIKGREDIQILFDKAKDLDAKDVESILLFVKMIRKQRGFDE